jgi:hypothetical protein
MLRLEAWMDIHRYAGSHSIRAVCSYGSLSQQNAPDVGMIQGCGLSGEWNECALGSYGLNLAELSKCMYYAELNIINLCNLRAEKLSLLFRPTIKNPSKP